MKLKIEAEIDCTPEELKELWNAPNLKPLQDAFAAALEAQMRQQLAASPAAAWMKLWGMDGTLQALTRTPSRDQ
jgi:hypothetical protein